MNRHTFPRFFNRQKGLLHGGDYNPEQWPVDVWQEDNRLMSEAKVNSVCLGIFSWVSLEPSEGVYDFDWLDKQMDIQAEAGRSVCLATPTAAVPAWMSQQYPEIRRTGPDGVRKRHGNRVNMCWSSPIFREKCLEIGTKLAERYGNHPALGCWHISNEYSGHCFCGLCTQKFQEWLQARYGTLDNLNKAYWSKFWSHTYTDWTQLEIPCDPHGETSVLGMTLDWKRFSSYQIIDFYRMERDNLKAITPNVPCTTNLMGTYEVVDGFEIAKSMDFVSWDSYPWFNGRPDRHEDWVSASFMHDLNRSMKQGQPFLLMECAPSASNWYSTMHLKRPGQHELEGLQAIAHGADGVQYFQWRQSSGSIEQFHGAVIGHNDRKDAKVFRDVVDLGRTLESLAEVAGSSVPSQIALIYDWENAWALDTSLGYRNKQAQYGKTVCDYYRPLFWNQYEVDILPSTADFSPYKVVIAPMLFMLRPGVAESLAEFVEEGGTLITTYLSGWVDENLRVHRGGYPAPLSSVLGIWAEEWDELYEDQSNGIRWMDEEYKTGTYCERIHTTTADTLAKYTSDFYQGAPALTRNHFGSGQAYHIASRNDAAFTSDFLLKIVREAGIEPAVRVSTGAPGVSIRRRQTRDADYYFLLNYSMSPVEVTLDEPGLSHVTGGEADSQITLPGFGSTVLVKRLVPVGS